MPKFRKRPVVIEAMQYRRADHIAGKPLPPGVERTFVTDDDGAVHEGLPVIHTLEGPLRVSDGDWIIKGVKGEFYPCKPDIFDQTYEPVDTVSATVTARQREQAQEIVSEWATGVAQAFPTEQERLTVLEGAFAQALADEQRATDKRWAFAVMRQTDLDTDLLEAVTKDVLHLREHPELIP